MFSECSLTTLKLFSLFLFSYAFIMIICKSFDFLQYNKVMLFKNTIRNIIIHVE